MKKVLIIEDNADLRILYKQKFINENFSVDETADASKALQLLRHNLYDVIITDLLFPSMDGLQLIRNIKAKDSKNIKTPIIVITNLDHGDKTKNALKAGAAVCLFKAKHTASSLFAEVNNFLNSNLADPSVK